MSGAERALHFFARPLLRCFYRVTAHGLENLPELSRDVRRILEHLGLDTEEGPRAAG